MTSRSLSVDLHAIEERIGRASQRITSEPAVAYEAKQLATRVNHALREADAGGQTNYHRFTGCALTLTETDAAALANAGQIVHAAVEQILGAVASGDDELARHFCSLDEYRPYLTSTSGRWQSYSRYDFALGTGVPQIIELNTCCPAGYVTAPAHVAAAKHFWSSHGGSARFVDQDFDDARSFAHKIVALEREAGFEPGLVALLYDENHITFELSLMRSALEAIGREAVIADARTLELRGQRLCHEGRPISVSFNKFRIGPNEPHCWRPGYGERYQAFLQAVVERSFLPINNFMAMTFGEDKGLLECLTSSAFTSRFGLDPELARLVPWTRRLSADRAEHQGETVDLLRFTSRMREQLVIKPAHSGRGAGVFIGAECSQPQWDELLDQVPREHYIVQAAVPSITLDVAHTDGEDLRSDRVFQTGSIFLWAGQLSGVYSRVSRKLVTNVSVDGLVQPVLVLAE